MNEKRNLTIEEAFASAIQNHRKNKFEVAENLYKEILKKVLDLFEDEKGSIQHSRRRKMKMIFKGKYVDYPLSIKSIFQKK